MDNMNRATLAGYVGADPEVGETSAGKPIARFSFATTERRDEAHRKTEWHDIVAFGVHARRVQERVRKGEALLVEGRIAYRELDRDGVKRKITEIEVGGPADRLNILTPTKTAAGRRLRSLQ